MATPIAGYYAGHLTCPGTGRGLKTIHHIFSDVSAVSSSSLLFRCDAKELLPNKGMSRGGTPMQDHHAGRIEGYAIVSEDGMLATAAGIMPELAQVRR